MDTRISLNTINIHPNPKKISTYSSLYNPYKPGRRQQPIPCSMHPPPNNSMAKSVEPIITNKTKRSSSPISFLYDTFVSLIDPPLHPSVDPTRVFAGNFSPVDELWPTECPVVHGEIPVSLYGVYIRNGPNPQHMPRRGPLHFFEGDGMLHSLKLSEGRAIYACRYVKTYKFKLEREAGFPIFPNMLSGLYGLADMFRIFGAVFRALLGQINLMEGFGLANTSLAFFSSKLVALGESDLPYILDLKPEGDVETLGRWDFDKKLFANMTAHPKSDMNTKETFAFKCSPVFPYLTFFSFDENGVKQEDVPIFSVDKPTIIHDFAITERFAVFPQAQLVVAPSMVGKGMPVVCDPSKVPRIGIMPRYAKTDAEMTWFEAPGFNAMHIINAWENGDDEIVLVAPNAKSIENILKSIGKVHCALEKVIINVRTGEVSRKVLSTRNLEFGSINGSYQGKKNRYAYLGIVEEVPRMSGVVKIDLEVEREVSRSLYGAGCYGGEPLFVARNHAEDADEDDGFVVSYIHDENSGESKFIVMDAKSDCLDIVAAVKLPRRVPYGFHGLFLHDDRSSSNNNL